MLNLKNNKNTVVVTAIREVKKPNWFKPALVVGMFSVGMAMFVLNFMTGLACGFMLVAALMAKTFHRQEIQDEA